MPPLAAFVALFMLLVLSLGGSSGAAEKARGVFISGAPSHARMKHEHRAGNMILAQARSVNPHWPPKFKDFPNHPIANGLKPFCANDEWYYHIRFVQK